MSLPRIHYHVMGQEDYMLVIDLAPDGQFRIDAGDYSSHPPRKGRLSPEQRATIEQRLQALGPPGDWPAPEGASGFIAELEVDAGPRLRQYRFWEGALDGHPAIRDLVRTLELL